MPGSSPALARLDAAGWEAPAALRRRHRLERWAAACGLLILTLVLFAAGLHEPVENRLTEMRARMLDRAPTGQVAIVEIDAKSIAARKNWPWPRHYHAELIKRLSAAGVSMIAFDVDFSAKSNPADDAALARSLAVPQPVILPVFQQRASSDAGEHAMLKSRPAQGFERAWIGGVNILPGPDGVVRDFPAATMMNGEVQPAMAVLISDNGGLGARTFVPDWAINARQIPRFSFNDVVDGRIPAKALAGKRIIVGATAIELGDRYAIPRFGTVPGVVIQALAAESLLQHRAMTRSGWLPTLAGLLIVAGLLVGRFARFGRSYPLAASVVFGTLTFGPIAVQSRWPLSIDTAPLWFAALGAIALRLIVEARYRVRLAALRDPETQLPNERALDIALQEEANAEVYLTTAAVDRFELIRSALPSADMAALIADAAGRIRDVVGATVYRIAPDTFAWLTSADADPEPCCARIGNAFAEPVRVAGAAVDVSLTFGMAAKTYDTTPAQLIERGLAAMTDARNRGVTRQWFRGVAADTLRDLSLMGELRRGITEDQLFVAYQPKLSLKSGSIAQAEALVRWRHPVEGLVPPDRFLPLAEETGVVREITRFVLRRVMEECGGGSPAFSASVNVSAADIIHPEFASEVIRMLADTGFDPKRLTLEITESAIIRSQQTALQVLETLRNFGVRLSIDDYGTGQSTLSYLKTLPVDELKIDKMFVTRLCENEGDLIMVRSTVDLAHQLGLTVVAEGVEDWNTIGRLAELGCDYAQGYAVGRAMLMDELRALAQAGAKRAA